MLAVIGFVIFSARFRICIGVSFFSFKQVFVKFRRSIICQHSSRTRSRPRHAASAPAAATAAAAAAALLLLFCNCCLLIPSAVFLGALPSLNCHCADASFTMYAIQDISSSLPLLSFVTPFLVSTHLHDSSDSSYHHFNLMPCFLLRQVVCQILFASNSSHFYCS